MTRENSVLLVEGYADKIFFEHVFSRHSVEASVKVSVPTDWADKYNTKGAVFNTLPILIDQMSDGRLKKLAVVVDSDLEEHGGGQLKTLAMFADLVKKYGFEQRYRVGEKGGYLFHHKDGLSPVGLWIMPDNEHDGVIEHFVRSCIIDIQKERFERGVELLDASVQPFLFEQHRRIKAEISGWLAWQKNPGQGIFSCIREGLIDQESHLFKKLRDWLSMVF
jgi:hypothetical protein